MKKERPTTWYLEPLDAATNKNALMDLADYCGATAEKIHRQKLDNKGKKHDVVDVEHSFITRMERSIPEFNHRFKTYTQEEGESRMNLWRFGGQGKLSRTKEVKRVKKEIEKLSKPKLKGDENESV